jgi:Cu-Zn family superoxide dismutase
MMTLLSRSAGQAALLALTLSALPACADQLLAADAAPAHAAPAHARGGHPAAHAEATIRDRAGAAVGFARFSEDSGGRLHVTVHAEGLTPGLHGLHLHAVGACDGSTTPPFASAGGHYNPTGHQHGTENPHGHHAGDLPNLAVNAAGVGRLTARVEGLTVGELFDANGTAIVVHQDEDDYETDSGPRGPGNSGPRVACGVLEQR